MADKFHLVDGEPRPCKASIRSCPVGGEHFNSEAEARSSYESSNERNIFNSVNKKNNNSRRPMDPMKKFNIQVGVGVLAVTTIGVGALAHAAQSETAHHNNVAKQAAQTSYSITVQRHSDWNISYTAKITDSNLKETNFDKCITTPKHEGESGSRGPILCKTSDGKYTVRIQHTGKSDRMTKAVLTIKDGKNNGKISDFKIDKHDGNNILIPKNSNIAK